MNVRDLPRESTPPAQDRATARSQLWSWLLVLLAVAVLWRARPLIEAYFGKLVALHGLRTTLLAAVAGAAGFALLAVSLWRWPRLTFLASLAAAVALALISGNLGSLLMASAILAATLVLGDAAARLVRGREAREDEELVPAFAAGVVSVGLLVLLLGEIRLLGRPVLLLCAVGLLALRRAHLRVLARRMHRAAVSLAELRPASLITAGWTAFTLLVLAAIWVGVLSPEVGWDALAYHLPEVRDIVLQGRVEPLSALAPQTLFWRQHESFLAAGFFFGGEAVVRFLHFAVGMGAFAAVLALVSKLHAPAARPLALLSLAAFPFACYQLRSTYVDWPAAFLVAAAAVAFASTEEDPQNGRLGAVFFAGAIATKIFALFAAPALALLAWRRHAFKLRGLPLIVLLTLAPLLPWLAWSESRAGFFLAPYASSFPSLTSRLTGGYFFVSPALPADQGTPQTASRSLRDFALLPYSLTYHTSRFENFRDGYGGVFALLILPGVLGWGPRRFANFAAAALAVLVPWYFVHDPAYRYLLPVYPLYAVFAVVGLWRLTGGFEGLAGRAAAACLLAAAFALPVQLGSSGVEWKVATGLLSREQALEMQLSSYPLWRATGPTDRVLFLGEFDLYHCRCERAYRFGYHPVSDWGLDPERWRNGLADLGIDYIAYRDQKDFAPLLEGLRSDLLLVGENRDAKLYRVKRR